MVDQVTSGSGVPSLADEILKQAAAAEQSFRKELSEKQAEIQRLSEELKTLAQELETLTAAPGDHQAEIAAVQRKIAEKTMAIDRLADEIKATNLKLQQFFDVLTQIADQLNKAIRDAAGKISR
jgi:chromosome segregation ATPase